MISKEEMLANFKRKQIEKAGGEKQFKSQIRKQHTGIAKALSKAKAPSESYKMNYQKSTGRAYSE